MTLRLRQLHLLGQTNAPEKPRERLRQMLVAKLMCIYTVEYGNSQATGFKSSGKLRATA